MRVAIVTGASGGIGAEAVVQLAAAGFKVYACGRNQEQLERLAAKSIIPLQLDVTSEASIQEVIKKVVKVEGRIDVLVNNAGYGQYGSVEQTDPKLVVQEFAVNVFGLGAMCQAVLPIMREQGEGRIINIASVVGHLSLPFAGWYCASKYAVEGLSDALRREVAPFGIKVVMIEPGAIRTNFEDTALNGLADREAVEGYQERAKRFATFIHHSYKGAPGPEVVAKKIVRAATVSRPRGRYAVPFSASFIIAVLRFTPHRLVDRIMNQSLL